MKILNTKLFTFINVNHVTKRNLNKHNSTQIKINNLSNYYIYQLIEIGDSSIFRQNWFIYSSLRIFSFSKKYFYIQKDMYNLQNCIYKVGNRGLPWFMFLLLWLIKLPEFYFLAQAFANLHGKLGQKNKISEVFWTTKAKLYLYYKKTFFFKNSFEIILL